MKYDEIPARTWTRHQAGTETGEGIKNIRTRKHGDTCNYEKYRGIIINLKIYI